MEAENTKRFTMKFEGDQHRVRATTFANVLANDAVILQELSKSIAPGSNVQINITATKEGSLEYALEVVGIAAGPIAAFGPAGAYQVAVATIKSMVNLHLLMARLKGRPAKRVTEADEIRHIEGDEVVIEGDESSNVSVVVEGEGDVRDIIIVDTVAFNAYNQDSEPARAIRKKFQATEDDPNVSGFSIEDEEQEIRSFRVGRDSFNDMQAELEREEREVMHEKVWVFPFSWAIRGRKNWDMIFDGREIRARVDRARFRGVSFYDQIGEQDLRFSRGDRMQVNLLVKQEWDEEMGTYENKGYEVSRVYKYEMRPEDQDLFDPPE